MHGPQHGQLPPLSTDESQCEGAQLRPSRQPCSLGCSRKQRIAPITRRRQSDEEGTSSTAERGANPFHGPLHIFAPSEPLEIAVGKTQGCDKLPHAPPAAAAIDGFVWIPASLIIGLTSLRRAALLGVKRHVDQADRLISISAGWNQPETEGWVSSDHHPPVRCLLVYAVYMNTVKQIADS